MNIPDKEVSAFVKKAESQGDTPLAAVICFFMSSRYLGLEEQFVFKVASLTEDLFKAAKETRSDTELKH